MIETRMRQSLRANIPKSMTISRIETGATEIGFPDTFYYNERPQPISGWMELKHVKTFDKECVSIPWRKGQLLRGLQLVRAEVNLWLAVTSDFDGSWVFIPGYLWAHSYSRGFKGYKNIHVFKREEINKRTIMGILLQQQYEDDSDRYADNPTEATIKN